MWVHAMYKFYFINKIVAPKKAALKAANEKLNAVQKVLDVAKAKVAEVSTQKRSGGSSFTCLFFSFETEL